MQNHKARVSSLPQISAVFLKPPKRKDPGRATIPNEFLPQTKAKNIKSKPLTLSKIPEKFVKPRIIWKQLNKFNIKSKFLEIITFMKNTLKRILNILKESQNVYIFIEKLKPDYLALLEKLTEAFTRQNLQKKTNENCLKKLQQKKTELSVNNDALKAKIQEFTMKNQEMNRQIQKKIEEYNALKLKNADIEEKYNDVSAVRAEAGEKVFKQEAKNRHSEEKILRISTDLKKEEALVSDLQAKVDKKKQKLSAKQQVLGATSTKSKLWVFEKD